MDTKNLLQLIDKENLFYMTLDKMSASVAKLTNFSKEESKEWLVKLIQDGDLMYDDNKKLFLTSKRGYQKCKIIANKKGYAFAELIDNPDNMPDIFISKDMLAGALDDDIVLVQIVNRQEDGSCDGQVVQIVKHVTDYVVGEFKVTASKCYVIPDDEKFPTLRINRPDRMGAVEGDKVVAKVVFDQSGAERRGIIIEKLGKAGTVSAEELAIVRQYKIRDKFNDSVVHEAEQIPQDISQKDKEGRLDFSMLNIITIDGEDSRDFDDAISVEKTKNGYTLGVHIADVSNYVKSGSTLDDEAYLRGNSVYFPDYVIPMLPERLSNGICSLREGVERLTLSCIMELDQDCKVKKSKIVKSWIVSKHRMTYTKVQKMLDGDQDTIKEYKDIYNDVLLYAEISSKLKKLREARGEIRFDIPEPVVVENDKGEIDRIEKTVQDESHELIESLMILANEVVAETFFTKKLPFVYRVHEKPDSSKVTKLVDVFKGLGINANIDTENPTFYDYQKLVSKIDDDPRKTTLVKLILRSMMKACYSDKCLGHFGIASTFYCHFTSPIRRYPDLLIHRIIKHFLDGETGKNLHLEFDDIVDSASTQASLTERIADEAERAVDDYKKALYMKNHLGEIYEGTVSGVHEFGVFVELDNTIEGLIRFEYLPVDSYDYDDKAQILKGIRHSYRLGDKLQVVCVNANTKLRQIDFDLAEKLNNASIEELIAMRNNNLSTKYSKQNNTDDFSKSSAKSKSNKDKQSASKGGKTSKKNQKYKPKENSKHYNFGKRKKNKYSRKNIDFDY